MNNDPVQSIGGPMSIVVIADRITNALFANQNVTQAMMGNVDYKCIYIFNNEPVRTFYNAYVWFTGVPFHPNESMDMAIGTSMLNGIEQQIQTPNSPPYGVAFARPKLVSTALQLGSIPPQTHLALWLRRTLLANARPAPIDTCGIQVAGYTTQ